MTLILLLDVFKVLLTSLWNWRRLGSCVSGSRIAIVCIALGRQAFCALGALIADAAQAEHDQRHAEEIEEGGLFGLCAEQIVQDDDAAPIGDRLIGDESNGKNHQYVGEFACEGRRPRERK